MTGATYVIAYRYQYYGRGWGPWSLYTVDAGGMHMVGGMVARYASREDAERVVAGVGYRLPDGAGDREVRVMRSDTRMARRLMRAK